MSRPRAPDPDGFLLGDAPPPRRGRPRWVDALGLVAVVGAILSVGLVGGDGDPSRPTTTTTAPRSTTTSRPEVIGRTLPFDTGTTLLLLGTAAPKLFDVDAGRLRTADAAGTDALGLRTGFVFANPGRVTLLGADGRTRPLGDRVPDTRLHLATADGDRVWVPTAARQGAGTTLVEVTAFGEETGRRIDLPAGAEVAGAVDAGPVVTQLGSITVIDAEGRGRALGAGAVLAARGHLVARLDCPLLRCQLQLVDVRTGTATVVADAPAVAGGLAGAFSASGRWLAVRVFGATGRRFVLLVDVAGTRLGRQVEEADAFAFAARDDVLFTADDGELRAYVLPAGDRYTFRLPTLPVRELAAAPTPP